MTLREFLAEIKAQAELRGALDCEVVTADEDGSTRLVDSVSVYKTGTCSGADWELVKGNFINLDIFLNR